MRLFSFRPALTMSGRSFNGLRGMAGKPLHPPLTDLPIGAYLLAAAFDVISVASSGDLSREMYRAATFALVGGLIGAVLAATTGVADWWQSTPRRTQAWRTANAHGLVMATATVLVLIAVIMRLGGAADDPATSTLFLILTLAVVALTALGGALGGSLVYDYGFNVETAGDSPVWHESEADVLPGAKP